MKKMSVSLFTLFAVVAFSAERIFAAAEPPSTNAVAPAKPASAAAELFPDAVIAKGKGFEIKRSELDETVTSIKASAVGRGQVISSKEMLTMERQLLDRLIQIKVLLMKAGDAERAKGKQVSSNRFENIKGRAGSEEALNRQLKSVGMTQEDLRRRMNEEATAEAVLEHELNVNVSEAEIKKFYDENPTRFEQPEMVRASHILLTTRDQATNSELTEAQKAAKHKQMEDILKRARTGEDFAKLAKEFSEDPGSKDSGGEYTFPRGRMVKEFEAAAFSLNTNQISDIVTTQFGYHIIKLSEKLPPKKMELAKVKQDITDYLKGQLVQVKLPEYEKQKMKEAGVEILDEKLKSVTLPPPPPPGAAQPANPETKKP